MSQTIAPILNSSFTANGQTLGPIDVSQYNVVSVTASGTHSGVTITMEVSHDGILWGATTFANIASASSATASLQGTNATTFYEASVGGFNWFRIRSTSYTSGTLVITVGGSSAGWDPIPNVQVTNTPTVTSVVTPGSTTGGVATNHHLVSAATTNATSVKVTAGSVGHIVMVNTSAAAKYVKLFNKASAPTVGTDTPTVTFQIPANSQVIFDPAMVYRMTTGIAYCITNLAPDLDTTAVAAGDVIVSINYI